ncbi:MAG TPA: sigma-70 family RNA polymerase sigma factor, partial [Urbifossiella sp.]
MARSSDGELLARFLEWRDEEAFELLLRRHAAMVLGTCRRILADPNDADDAFQAVFLVLARKAGSIAQAEVISAWLHRVAIRTALKMRASFCSHNLGRQAVDVEQIAAPDSAPLERNEFHRVLDEEIERLPARHRMAFVLCCLEGKTGEEAGRLLGCPPGTVSSRLTRARERLRERLGRRGFAPAFLAAALAADTLAAAPAPSLI